MRPLSSPRSSGTRGAERCAGRAAKAIQHLTLFCVAVPSHPCEEPHPWLVIPQQTKPDLLRL